MKKTILACSLGLMALALTACSGEEKSASSVPVQLKPVTNTLLKSMI